mmetsp:Transcript_1145/g.1873  ORF Transcript_1145/g.1873 Transcript_1145/m.1873 type:complete len:154 (-) Transcript_1145:423-884(-)
MSRKHPSKKINRKIPSPIAVPPPRANPSVTPIPQIQSVFTMPTENERHQDTDAGDFFSCWLPSCIAQAVLHTPQNQEPFDVDNIENIQQNDQRKGEKFAKSSFARENEEMKQSLHNYGASQEDIKLLQKLDSMQEAHRLGLAAKILENCEVKS